MAGWGQPECGVSASRNATAGGKVARVAAADLAAARWKKSLASTYAGNCVEVAQLGSGLVGVRDSKAGGAGPVLVVGEMQFSALLTGIKSGRFAL
jgi:hypothetical protein